MYEITLSILAEKQLKKLNKELRKRIISTLERCRIRPYSYVKRIVGSEYFSLRTGDYRIILDVKNNELRIFVIEIGHRKKIYKGFKN
ncbi:MAG: type II toxin-antitoxin system RelE/ParE family toxin [Nanoarchaeota archaeon]|nr:type II toxin-antitoxin system RelE/ParE family toxin [Nanoarchaeota archaeon]